MSRTYRTIGINLKGVAMGENDRLLTILTREHGLIRAVAAGARKHRSNMTGRSGLFVVNDLLISPGRSLDRIKHAETLQSFIGLGHNLAKLTAAQYLAELTLIQALSAQPQEELFELLTEHLIRLQNAENHRVLACLVHGVYHLLAIAGFAPQVHACCFTQEALIPPADLKWRVGFSFSGGGIVSLSGSSEVQGFSAKPLPVRSQRPETNLTETMVAELQATEYQTINRIKFTDSFSTKIDRYLNATELIAMQSLVQPELSQTVSDVHSTAWLTVERLLRAYAQYHFDKPIQSAALIDNCFNL
ncbi:DNA repair protein RecO [Tumidithrix elongata RA019]|uniref:DNA repair protein RecO n=1 Tax=Tumidithrix elongata BACA0141 TaxID=2716417 RepID=A0AAW9PP93_9CYAN|nr:DNA repair protein RecO [Tumidithrix elongata RA019]